MTRPVVTLVAGGWSATRVDLDRLPGIVIGVNDAAKYLPRFDHCVSMDRLWAENRIDWIEAQKGRVWLRASTVGKIRERVAALNHVELFQNSHTATVLSTDPKRLDGTHSGFCGLNLAFHLMPQILYLVGFDIHRGPGNQAHWFPQYEWVAGHATTSGKFESWARQFTHAATQFRVAGTRVYRVNVSRGEPPLSSTFESITPLQLARRAALETAP